MATAGLVEHRRPMTGWGVIPLFVVTALAEIGGCYLVFLWRQARGSYLLLVGAAACLVVFAGLLSVHPNAGRAYAAYGGVYVALAVLWGWRVEGQVADRWDLIGSAVCVVGTMLILFGPRP